MREYFLVLTETLPNPTQPKGGVVFRGFFYSERDLVHAAETPVGGIPEGEHVVYYAEAEEGKAPASWTRKRKKLRVAPRVDVDF